MGGCGAHEFMVLNEFGEDTLVLCDACGYAENQQIADGRASLSPAAEAPLPMEDVETPGATTIDDPRRVPRASRGAGPPRPRSS